MTNRRATVDPHLQRQVDEATGAVAATFTLRNRDGDTGLTPAETHSVVHEMIERVAKATKARPTDVNVYPNLQSFAVDAPAKFVERLLDAPEIDSAISNQQRDDMLIRPVADRQVELEPTRKRGPRKAAPRKRSR